MTSHEGLPVTTHTGAPAEPASPLTHVSTSCPSLHDFQRLPHDLQATIFIMACLQLAQARPAQTHRPVVYLDANTAKALALVCKDAHDIVVRVLYEKIHITRPSTLRLLVTTLIKRPRLGQLIKSLHIGPEDVPPDDWLPFWGGAMYLSMPTPTDSSRYHSCTCGPFGHPVPLSDDMSEHPTLAVKAIQRAIATASELLDVDMYMEGLDWEEEPIPKNLWYFRAFMTWAAVELYVLEMKRYDKRHARGADMQASLRYPRLQLTGPPITSYYEPPESFGMGGPTYHLSTNQLRARLATPKSKVDRFDHPLIFARSAVAWEAEGPDGQRRSGGNSKRRRHDRLEDASSVAPCTRVPTLASTATVKGILGLASTLLYHTTQLQNLSLTGFLERVVCGGYASKLRLDGLRSLSLGPPPRGWAWTNELQPNPKALQHIEKLRLCGHVLSKAQAMAVDGGGMMTKVRIFQWSYPERITGPKGADSSHLLNVINILIGRHDTQANEGSGKAKSGKRRKASLDQDEVESLLIVARLHPGDVREILNAAPDPATRAAWKEGADPPVAAKCRRRLRLVASEAEARVETLSCSERRAQLEEMYAEGRERFEEKSRRVGFRV